MKRMTMVTTLIVLFLISITTICSGSEIEHYTLKNGMVVVLLPDHSTPAVSMNIWVGVGGFNETQDQSGMSHFVEHMVFKGSNTLGPGEGPDIIEAAGGNFNAYTELDDTVLTASVPSSATETLIKVLSDTALDATFVPDELERERQVVLEEIRMDMDNPDVRISNLFFEKAFHGFPYGKPVIGTAAKVKGYSRDALYAWYKTHWRPENMVAVLVGDFDPVSVKPMIQHYLGQAPEVGVPTPPHIPYPVLMGSSVSGIAAPVQKTYLYIGFNTPPITDNDLYPLDVAALILGRGTGSRLYRAVVDKGLAYSIDASSYTPKEAGLFAVSATLDSSEIIATVRAAIEEFSRLSSIEVTDEELTKARNETTADFIFDKETYDGRASSLGFFETATGDVNFEKKYLAGISGVTGADIVRVAKKYFVPENMTITYLVPDQDKKAIADEEIKTAAIGAFTSPMGNERTPPALIAEPKGYKALLENGVRLVIKENHSLPIVSVVAAFDGGVRTETEKTNGVTNLVSSMLTRGTTSLTAQTIAERIELIAADIHGFSGQDTFGLKAEFLTQYQDEGWGLISDMIINPSFDSDELAKVKDITLAAIEEGKDDLPQRTIDLFKKTLYRSQPYGLPTIGTKSSVEGLSHEELVAYWGAHASPSTMVISVVGDVKADEVLKRVNDLFGGWKRQTNVPAAPMVITPPARSVTATETVANKEQAHIFLGFLGADYLSNDYWSMDVLTAVLSGMGGRMFVELREKQGLAYTVDAINHGGIYPGFFGIYMGTAPKNLTRSVAGIDKELLKVKKDGITAEELTRAKSYLIGNFELGLQSNTTTALTMATDEIYGLGYDFYLRYPEKIDAVTIDDVKKAADKYIDLNHSVLTIVKPSF